MALESIHKLDSDIERYIV